MKSSGNNLLKRLKNDDQSAFEEIFYQFNTKLERFAQGYLKNVADASDIVQNVFISLWEKRHTLSEETNLNSYLFTLTRNQALDHLKHVKVRQSYVHLKQSEVKTEIKLNIIALERLDMDSLMIDELGKAIQQAIDTLPGKDREIFLMSRTKGFTYKEIASVMHIAPATVEKRIRISLGLLREKLKEFRYIFIF